MSFAVELPGEVAPLTTEEVCRALKSAVCSDNHSIQTGALQLQAWESRRQYFTFLQASYFDKSLSLEVRYLAIIQLKNGIDKYWRRTATKFIVPEEKAHIRSRLLEGCIKEEEKKLAVQSALVVSKVVRIDFPNEWPEALPDLIKVIQVSRRTNQLHLQRALLMSLHIVKELASARLRASLAKITSINQELFFLICEIYLERVTYWASFSSEQASHENGDIVEAMETSLLALRTLRRLVMIGYESPNHSNDVKVLWEQAQQQFGLFFKKVSHLQSPVSRGNEIVEKHLLQLSKLHLSMATQHPVAFVHLPGSFNLVRAYWDLVTQFGELYSSEFHEHSETSLMDDSQANLNKPLLEKLCLKGLQIMRACIKMGYSPLRYFQYTSAKVKAEQKEAIELVKSELLTVPLIQHVANVIVTKLFLLRQTDLDAWEEEQEEWVVREEGNGDAWEFELRPYSERLFTDVIINFKDMLLNPLLSYFGSIANIGSDSILAKDAIYTAMGLSAPIVFQSYDFDSLISSTLVNDVQQNGPSFKVLRRRIAILLSQWIVIQISSENKVIVNQIFQHLLKGEDETNDLVVRISAARHFKLVVDEFSFDVAQFLPFAPEILGRIMTLVQEVDLCETKIAILHTIRVITNRLEKYIIPFADQIVAMLSSLWEVAGKEYLLKQSIFSILSTLVVSLQSASERYYSIMIPLVANSVASDSESRIYLLEDALDLWTNILETSQSSDTPTILSLVDSIFPLLELGSENLRSVLHILECYCILAPKYMLSDTYRFRTLTYMNSLLDVSKRDIAGLVTSIVEYHIRAAEKYGGLEGLTLISQDLLKTGLFAQILAGLRDSWEAHETSGVNKRYPRHTDMVETDYLTILARLIMADPRIFFDMVSSLGSFDEVWTWLSTEWFRHFDNMASIERQKLSCLALTRLLELPSPVLDLLLRKIQDFLAMWTQVINELIEGSEKAVDCLVWIYDGNYGNETSDVTRRNDWAQTDVVHKISTWDFVKEKMSHIAQAVGGKDIFDKDCLANVDKEVLMGYYAIGTDWQVK
ncbi:BgTH12-01818 [Blumeria graminis f. sp. triticale]|uniref:BgTH12-01818 n=1 Tax=Blumeria graminis f. sp. triticale TaxID=1689686 RepID=A0A9W4D074_BLUGR|nr:BgTH12-01818 [Blumeria graminis f. sp. triticale]